jgi:hypothetical protein
MLLSRRLRRFMPLVGASVMLLAFSAAPASASHLKGGTITAAISATGSLQVNVTWLQRKEPCTLPSGESLSLQIVAPNGVTTATVPISLPLVRCVGSTAVFQGSKTYELNNAGGAFGATAPSGRYTMSVASCCRVAGIINSSESGVTLTATLRNVPGSATSTPQFLGSTATGAAKGYVYSGDVTASEPLSGPITYALLQAGEPAAPNYDVTAPTTNVASLSGPHAEVPSATTEGWSVGQYFAYKVKASNATSDTAELDILVKVTNNKPPTLSVPAGVTVVAGTTVNVPLSATDTDSESVTINADSAPSWTTSASTSGSPATGQLQLAPPAGTSGTYYAALDATDTNIDVVLLDSKVITIHVIPPAPVLLSQPAEESSNPIATFTFQSVTGTQSQCSLDGGPWTACSSPFTTPALSVGAHSFSVRVLDESGAASGTKTWLWTVSAQAASQVKSAVVITNTANPVALTPSAPVCVSRRNFVIRWRVLGRTKVGAMFVTVSAHGTRRLSAHARRATIDLRGFRAGTVIVTVSTQTAGGKTLRTTRRYHPCELRKAPTIRGLALR